MNENNKNEFVKANQSLASFTYTTTSFLIFKKKMQKPFKSPPSDHLNHFMGHRKKNKKFSIKIGQQIWL